MQINGLSNLHGAQPINGLQRTQSTQAAPQADNWSTVDELEISPEAEFVSEVRDIPDIRADRVAEVRAQITSGVYETSEKLDMAVGRLLDEISG